MTANIYNLVETIKFTILILLSMRALQNYQFPAVFGGEVLLDYISTTKITHALFVPELQKVIQLEKSEI